MGTQDLKIVREHIEAMVQGRDTLTPEEIKAADGEMRGTLAALAVLNRQLKERTAAADQREAWAHGVVSAAEVAVWSCDVSSVRAMLTEEAAMARLDTDAAFVRTLAERIKIESINADGLKMFGAASREMLDGCLDELARDEGIPLFRSLLRAIGRGDAYAKLEGVTYALEGREIHVTVSLVAPDPTAATLTLAWADMTGNQKRLEAENAAKQQSKELERVNKDVERLFRAVSHDLRAPLRAVQNLAEWASEDLEAGNYDDVPPHLQALRGRVSRLEKMLTDLLSYARVGRAEHPYESVDVGELLAEVQGMVDPSDGFQVKWQAMPTVVTQRTLMVQVFLNLIGNALKHHDRVVGRVEVSAEDQDNFVMFRVADDGPGIPDGERGKVFGLFTTLKRRDEVEGSGMGLAFVQKVVRSLGGNIAVVGGEGRGTTFELTWPKGPIASKRKKSRPPTLVGFAWEPTKDDNE